MSRIKFYKRCDAIWMSIKDDEGREFGVALPSYDDRDLFVWSSPIDELAGFEVAMDVDGEEIIRILSKFLLEKF